MTTKTYAPSNTQALSIPDTRATFLRRVLYGNVAFTAISAGLFLLASESIANFLGIADVIVFNLVNGVSFITILGIGLALFGFDVLFVATRTPINIKFAGAIAIADFVWVAVSWLLLITAAIPFSDAGNWAVLIVADIVLLFGIAEIVGIRRLNR